MPKSYLGEHPVIDEIFALIPLNTKFRSLVRIAQQWLTWLIWQWNCHTQSDAWKFYCESSHSRNKFPICRVMPIFCFDFWRVYLSRLVLASVLAQQCVHFGIFTGKTPSRRLARTWIQQNMSWSFRGVRWTTKIVMTQCLLLWISSVSGKGCRSAWSAW